MVTLLLLTSCILITDPAIDEKVGVADADTDADSDTDTDADTDTASSVDADGDGFSVSQGDCNDADSSIHPGASEDCATPDDDNCNGDANDANAVGCSDYYADADGDLFGAGVASCLCVAAPPLVVLVAGDCDDAVAVVNPDADEVCDGVDNDCDGLTDDADDSLADGGSYYDDVDGDGYGDPLHGTDGWCSAPDGTVADNTDCFDGSASAHPGEITYFGSDRGDHSFDFDCDGRETPRYPDTSSTGTAGSDQGWVTYATGAGDYGFTSRSSVPACGSSGYYYVDGATTTFDEMYAEGAELVWSRSSSGYAVMLLTVACR